MTDYPVILRRAKLPEREGMLPASIVLRDFGPGHPHRYVTHQRNDTEDSTRGHYWGGYFETLNDATGDFQDRVKRKHGVEISV